MRTPDGFDELISQVKNGKGEGIAVRPDGQIIPARPQDYEMRPKPLAAPIREEDPPPVTTVRKTIWG